MPDILTANGLLGAFVFVSIAWAITVERRLSRDDTRIESILLANQQAESRIQTSLNNLDRKLDRLATSMENCKWTHSTNS